MLNGNVVIETQFFDGDLLVSTSKVQMINQLKGLTHLNISGSSVLCVVLKEKFLWVHSEFMPFGLLIRENL